MTKSHVLSGIRWTLATTVLRRIITLVLFYFVAKWLSKEDLGVFREYCLVLGLFSVVSCLSLDFHYIIERRQSQVSLVALWQLAIISAVVGFISLSLASGWLGNLYQSGVLARLLRYSSIFLVIEILRRTVRAMASRRLQFRELALGETWNVVFYSVLTFIALYFYRSVWVYVVAFYLGNALETIYLWRLNKICIKTAFKQGASRIGLWIQVLKSYRVFVAQATLVSVINQVGSNAPVLILGMLVEPFYIGLYFFASTLIGVPVGMFNAAVGQVFFPVFAGKKDGDIAGMASRYLRLVGNLGLPLLLLFSFVMMYAVQWLFGAKWGEAVPLIPIMFIIYGGSLYVNPIGGIPFIKRKAGWELGWNTISLVIKTGAMLWGLQTSFTMALWAFAITSVVMSISFYLISMHLIDVSFRATLGKVLLSLMPVLVLGILFYLMSDLIPRFAIGSALVVCMILLMLIDILSKGLLRADVKLLLRSEN